MSEKTTRNFSLSDAEVARLKAEFESSGKHPNPYRGSYGAIIAALISLGMNKTHSFTEIRNAVRDELGGKWAAFAEKDSRNENGKDADGRLLQNCQTLMRRKDYGRKLDQLAMGIVKVKQPDGSAAFGLFVAGDNATARPKAAKGKASHPKAKIVQKAVGKAKKIAKKSKK